MIDDTDCKKAFGTSRWVSVLLRSIHISAMGVVLGGVFLCEGYEVLIYPVWATLLSGGLMLLMDILKDPLVLLQGSGLVVILKLALLSIGFFFLPEHRFGWYLTATLVASVGSHMPGRLRHHRFFRQK